MDMQQIMYGYAGKVQLSLVCQMLINVNVKTFRGSYTI